MEMVHSDYVSLQAVTLDDSDVTVWYHLGVVAMKTFDLCLARHSFEEVCNICSHKVILTPGGRGGGGFSPI